MIPDTILIAFDTIFTITGKTALNVSPIFLTTGIADCIAFVSTLAITDPTFLINPIAIFNTGKTFLNADEIAF